MTFLISVIGVIFWKRFHPRSFLRLTLFGVWILPFGVATWEAHNIHPFDSVIFLLCFCRYTRTWGRMVVLCAIFTAITAYLFFKASRKPLDKRTPRYRNNQMEKELEAHAFLIQVDLSVVPCDVSCELWRISSWLYPHHVWGIIDLSFTLIIRLNVTNSFSSVVSCTLILPKRWEVCRARSAAHHVWSLFWSTRSRLCWTMYRYHGIRNGSKKRKKREQNEKRTQTATTKRRILIVLFLSSADWEERNAHSATSSKHLCDLQRALAGD